MQAQLIIMLEVLADTCCMNVESAGVGRGDEQVALKTRTKA